MQKGIAKASNEELKQTRSLLRAHVLACNIYQLAKEPIYYDGQPVNEAIEKASRVIEQIDTELKRREHTVYRYYLLNRPPGIGTHPGSPSATEVWLPMRRIPEQPAGYEYYAHGWVEYTEPVSENDVSRYQLWHVGMREA